MATFKEKKTALRQWLENPGWSKEVALPAELLAEGRPERLVDALIACLPMGRETAERAAFALGLVMRDIQAHEDEQARNLMRRLMWHMNEESGNIGWGVPEAMAWIMALCGPLAERYHRILISYILPLEGDSNFCDHALLRRSCFRAVKILLEVRPEYAKAAQKALLAGLNDEDEICRQAALALCRCYGLTDGDL